MNKVFLAFALLALSACSGVSKPLPKVDSKRWEITGSLVQEGSNAGIPNQAIDLIRNQKSCPFCKQDSVKMISFRTDDRGNFEISSEVPGSYQLVSKGKSSQACLAEVILGELESQQLEVVMKVKDKGCYMEM